MAVKATTGSIAVHFVPQLTPVRTTRVMKSAVGHRKVIKVVSPDQRTARNQMQPTTVITSRTERWRAWESDTPSLLATPVRVLIDGDRNDGDPPMEEAEGDASPDPDPDLNDFRELSDLERKPLPLNDADAVDCCTSNSARSQSSVGLTSHLSA
jgi:hypothetical protein